MTLRIGSIVYVVGVIALGLAYSSLKQALSETVFLLSVLAYLIALAVTGRLLARRENSKSDKQNDA